jgi:hypothetical protein
MARIPAFIIGQAAALALLLIRNDDAGREGARE